MAFETTDTALNTATATKDYSKKSNSALATAIAGEEHCYIGRLRSACYIRRRLVLKNVQSKLLPILASFDRLYEFHYYQPFTNILLNKERSMTPIYTDYYAVLESFEMHALQELEDDELLRHVVLTECKLACGEWTDVKELVRLPHHHLHRCRLQFQMLLQSTGKENVKQYMAIASELCTLNHVIAKIEQWREQKALFNQLAINIRGLRIVNDDDEHDGGSADVDRTHSLDDLTVHSLDRTTTTLRSLSVDHLCKTHEPTSKKDAERVLAVSYVRVQSFWHRMLILTPSHVVLCRPRGFWATCKLLFTPSRRKKPAIAEKYAVDERLPLKSILPRLNGHAGPSWFLQEGKVVDFRTDNECSNFLAALQQCILES